MSYSPIGTGYTQNSGSLTTFTKAGLTIPAGFIVVAVFLEKATANTATVTVGSTQLTQAPNFAFTSGTGLIAFYYGTVSASSQIEITGGVLYGDMTFFAWSWSGGGAYESSLGTLGGSNVTVAVTAGDYAFGLQNGSGVNWTRSTQLPSNTNIVAGADQTITFADWAVAATNASFEVTNSDGYGVFGISDFTPSGGSGGSSLTSLSIPRKIFLPPKKKFYQR